MSDLLFRSEIAVELVEVAGSDERIVHAARVSTLGARFKAITNITRFINFLMRGRHGSPFEHGMMTFLITAPDFVWWELVRHRIGFSYNLESARYKELEGVAYFPSRDRPFVQVGKPGAYTFVAGSDDQYAFMEYSMQTSYKHAWQEYKGMLEQGIAKELARVVLPFGMYRTGYVTCNPRSIMSLLSLRTTRPKMTRWRRFTNWLFKREAYPDPMFPSYPQHEIQLLANGVEEHFRVHFPITHHAFNQNGRVSP